MRSPSSSLRGTERPAREMRMLPDAVPQEESRAMARRLVEPVWKVVVEKGNERTKYEALLALANADPRGVLEKLESGEVPEQGLEFRIQTAVAAALAETDVEDASAVAESIADPAERAGALIEVVDALPDTERPRKLALLDRAALNGRAALEPARRLRWIGEAAEQLNELGEVEKAKVLFAEGLPIAEQMKGETKGEKGIAGPTSPPSSHGLTRPRPWPSPRNSRARARGLIPGQPGPSDGGPGSG